MSDKLEAISGERFLARRGFADSRNYSASELGPLLDEFGRERYNAGLDAAAKECGYVVEMYPATGADTEWSEGQICARAILALKGKP